MSSIPPISLVQLHNPPRSAAGLERGSLAALHARRNAFFSALDQLCLAAPDLDDAAAAMIDAIRSGGRVLIAGNGGSAAEAQHFATELVGRFLRERDPMAVISLTADTAVLTAIANDYGFDSVFARQVGAYGRPGDVFVGFSTSGESRNVLNAVETARERGLTTVAITGGKPSTLAEISDVAIRVPARDTPLIQELHTIVLHVLCDLIETAVAVPEPVAVVH